MSNTPKRKPGRKPAKKTPKGLANARKPEKTLKKGKTVTCAPAERPYGADWRELYLEELAKTGAKVSSAAAAGVSYKTVWCRCRDDAEFAADFETALKIALGGWEEEARRRAVEGTENVTYGPNGEVKSVRREYSDTILLRMLGRADPTWRDKQEISHTGGVDVVMTRAERIARLEKARADAKRPLS